MRRHLSSAAALRLSSAAVHRRGQITTNTDGSGAMERTGIGPSFFRVIAGAYELSRRLGAEEALLMRRAGTTSTLERVSNE